MQLRAIIDALDRALDAKQFLEIEVVQQWESTFEGVTDLARSDSDDAELAALRAEMERATCGCTVRAATRPCVAIASGCVGTGRGTAEEWFYPNLGHRPDNE